MTGIDELCDGPHRPDLVVECAGQGSVAQYGKAVLQRGLDLAVISTGAFADVELHKVSVCRMVIARPHCVIYPMPHVRTNTRHQDLMITAQNSGARILLPSGAVAGLDGLTALRVGGLDW